VVSSGRRFEARDTLPKLLEAISAANRQVTPPSDANTYDYKANASISVFAYNFSAMNNSLYLLRKIIF
jgi:hypothetical protein